MKKEKGKILNTRIGEPLLASLAREASLANTSIGALISQILESHIKENIACIRLKPVSPDIYRTRMPDMKKTRRYRTKHDKH